MAIARTITTVPVEAEERTYTAILDTPYTGEYGVRVFREIVHRDAEGVVVAVPESGRRILHRKAADIATESVTLDDGTVVPAILVLAALPIFFDRWAEEDDVARAAAEAEQEA